VYRRLRRLLAMAKVKNISRSGSSNTYAYACVREIACTYAAYAYAHRRKRVIRSLEAASRDIGGYMPAGADLVVNLARGSFLEHVNTGLSTENFGLYARGGICRKSRRALALVAR